MLVYVINLYMFLLSFGILFSKQSFMESAEPWQLTFQEPATPVMEGIISFHNDIMGYLVAVGLFVMWLLFRCISFYNEKTNPVPMVFTYSTVLEVVWTIVPAFILMVIAVPSFALLYAMDEMIDPAVTLKVVGHQWYWSYEYSDYSTLEGGESLNFDSYMIQEEDLPNAGLRLLEVDNRIVLPIETHIRVLVTAADVLHSWSVPSFGVKVDACPGRLNQVALFIKRKGYFYGQCSEICGVNHGFMPISVEATKLQSYITWVANKLAD